MQSRSYYFNAHFHWTFFLSRTIHRSHKQQSKQSVGDDAEKLDELEKNMIKRKAQLFEIEQSLPQKNSLYLKVRHNGHFWFEYFSYFLNSQKSVKYRSFLAMSTCRFLIVPKRSAIRTTTRNLSSFWTLSDWQWPYSTYWLISVHWN